MRRALAAFAVVLASCGGAAAPLEPPPPAAAPAAASPAAASASARAPAPAEAPPPRAPAEAAGAGLDREIEAAVARVTRAMLEEDLAVLAQPRHHLAAPAGLQAAALHLETELGAAGYAVTRQPVRFRRFTADNVIGERAGSDPSRVIVVCGHYDAVPRTPGADDNASGVSGALAVARAVAPAARATIRFVGFAFEEQGLVGSAAYARSLSPEERARIVGVLNLDMIAYRDPKPGAQRNVLDEARPSERRGKESGDFIAALGLAGAPRLLGALEAARAYVPGLRVETLVVSSALLSSAPDLMRSDHASFWGVDVPAVTIVDTAEDRNPHYHRKTDTIATLDLDFATDVARWTAAAVLVLDRRR